jgi:hypothetical protein
MGWYDNAQLGHRDFGGMPIDVFGNSFTRGARISLKDNKTTRTTRNFYEKTRQHPISRAVGDSSIHWPPRGGGEPQLADNAKIKASKQMILI